ncbi:hypothetical protein ACO0LM_27255 [Undibacterium sp. Di26W]|uniref:hypothetical protein n=1 Tax=Undibacterium sp. Di26W TaxID=3413035 RepID=UPI003BEFBC6D
MAKMRKNLSTISLILLAYMAIFPATSYARPLFILEQQPELQQAIKGLFSLYRMNRFFTGEDVEATLGVHFTPAACWNPGTDGWPDNPIKTYCEQKAINPNKNYPVGYSHALNRDTPPKVARVYASISLEKLKPCLTLWELETFAQVHFKIAPPQRQPMPFIPPNTKYVQLETVYELFSDSDGYYGMSLPVLTASNCVKSISTGKVSAEVWKKM